MNRRSSAVVLVAAAACVLPGCTALIHTVWPCPAATDRSRLTRETPDAAVDFLVDAFRNRRIADIYETFHPDFIGENGGFSQNEFSVAYDKYEPDFVADAASLAGATREWLPNPPADTAVVRLRNAATRAEVVIAFAYRPKLRIVTKDEFVGTIEATVDKREFVGLEDGHLRLPADFDLTQIEGLTHPAVDPLTAADIVRLEIADDWTVRDIQAKNLRVLDHLKEHTGK